MTIPRRIVHVSLVLAGLLGPALLSAQGAPAGGVLHGFVREAESGEPIGFSLVRVDERWQARADREGYFRVPGLAPGEHRVQVRSLGRAMLDTTVTLSSQPAEFRMRAAPVELAGLAVEGVRAGERSFETPEVSVQTVTPAEIRRVPAALEADVFRSIQALPGVTSPGVLSGQLLVRGGEGDQNLFLLDGYPVLHPYHLFGAFSIFPVEAVQDAELWLAAPPARYGGRLSSVLDVALREGNRERLTGTASLGLVSSSAVVEGPHPRGAWFVGARSTYLDLVTREVLTDEVPYRFYDAYAKSYLDLTPSDRISGILFFGRDRLWTPKTNREEFNWTNGLVGASWRHLFGGRAIFEQRLSFSGFREHLQNGFSGRQVAQIRGENRTGLASARGDLRLDRFAGHRIEAGYEVQRRTATSRTAYFAPGYEEYPQLNLLYTERAANPPASSTWALYAQDDIAVTDVLRLRVGLRGEKGNEGLSLQPRLAAKYLLSDRVALTAGGGLIRQRIHLLQDPDVDLGDAPANIWLSADEPGVPVGEATHLVGGLEARLPYDLGFRAEAYQKNFDGLITLTPYNVTDRRFAIERLENASGRARGIDFSLTRQAAGRARGWVGYSLASTMRNVAGVNFPADPQPRQRFVTVGDIDTGTKWGFTARFEAFEGIPYTPPTEIVQYRPFGFEQGHFLTEHDFPAGFSNQCLLIGGEFLYGSRNSARTGWSKRLDLGTGRRWTDRRGWKWEFSVSVLNALLDPTGVFRPAVGRASRYDLRPGCAAPAEVVREPEFTLPAIPSVSVRIEF